ERGRSYRTESGSDRIIDSSSEIAGARYPLAVLYRSARHAERQTPSTMTLYKYVTVDRIDVFKNGLIRFTQPGVLNDPWEMRPYIERLMEDELFEKEVASKAKSLDQKKLARLAAEKLWNDLPRKQRRSRPLVKLEAQVLQLIRTNPKEFERLYAKHLGEGLATFKMAEPIVIKDIPNILNKTVGVLSLAEEPDHPLMWAHYGANHSGFVFAFDESHNFFTTRRSAGDDLSGLHQIIYSTDRPQLKSLFDPNMTWIPLFFTKDEEWKYEKEWRMVRPLSEASKVIENSAGNIYLFNLPPDCISGIIFGCQMSDDQQHGFIEMLKNDGRYGGISFSRALRDDRTFSLRLEPL
ncbi:MAG: DUF2971 domain-containing protein, partial [Acidobacteriota bacterium]